MAPPADYSALRALALGSGNEEEAVTVNHKDLIDKILARYPHKWTTIRELIQNAADASASKVSIHFETRPSPTVPAPQSTDRSAFMKHVCLHHTLHRLVVTNNGHPFRPADWSRLKRIAEGNPDETKIGAFGVGFYSVFDISDKPMVRSGRETLAFYYKGNTLYTRMGQVPPGDSRFPGGPSDTDFILDYRDLDKPVPELLSLGQYLAHSLPFITVETIELRLDDWNVLTLTKKMAPSYPISIPKDQETRSDEGKGIMKVDRVNRQVVQIDAKWLDVVGWKRPRRDSIRGGRGGFFSRLTETLSTTTVNTARKTDQEDLAKSNTATIFLHITTADLRSSVDSSFKKELERATKKSPPSNPKVAILTPVFDQPSPVTADSVDLFDTVLPKKVGSIFIGFPTSQTTGFLAHISAPSIIPTVERENIDLNSRYIGIWNKDLLRAAGILCRIAWVCEMDAIKGKLSSGLWKTSFTKEDMAMVLPEAIRLYKQFTFQESTPKSQVKDLIYFEFWSSNKKPSIPLLSSQGVLPSEQVRLATEDLSSFVQGIPVVPEELVAEATPFIKDLKTYGFLTEIKPSDVTKELENKALDEKQLRGFLEWSGKKVKENGISGEELRSMMRAGVATLDGKPVVLADIKYHVNPARIPAGLPYPPNTAPFSCTRGLPKGVPEALGWVELQILPWFEYLVDGSGGKGDLPESKDITRSPEFSAQVLGVLYKNWDMLSQSGKERVLSLLQDRTVMPTKMGMKKPAEAYLPTVRHFEDLPVVIGLTNVKDKFLVAIGVRKTPDVDMVIDRMLAPHKLSDGKPHGSRGKWNHVDFIRYLASMSNDIPSKDIERLRSKAIFPAEDEQDRTKPTATRYKITELFEPRDSLRKLRLPLLQWPGVYRSGSAEGRLLTRLGLQASPSALDLINVMAKAPANGDMGLYHEALVYFITNHHANGYTKASNLVNIPAYLPLKGEDPGKLAAPADCFLNERSKFLGFDILKDDLHMHAAKFGVKADPPIAECVKRLSKAPPQTRREARDKFGYLGSRLHDIHPSMLQQISSMPIVPVFTENESTASAGLESSRHVRFTSPQSCFIGSISTLGDIFELFDFVDFGIEANAFLEACGSKHMPGAEEIAGLIVREPAAVMGKLEADSKLQSNNKSQPHHKYERLLKVLASNISILKEDKALFKELKKARCLLAYRAVTRKPAQSGTENPTGSGGKVTDVDHAGETENEWFLASAPQIVLVKEDTLNYDLFKHQLLTAPQNDDLEEFYHALGSPYLNSVIEEDPRIGPIENDQTSAVKLQELIFERTRVFLHDQPKHNIKHNAEWLEKNLKVELVRSISLRLSLRNQNVSHVDKKTAASAYDQRRGWILYITEGYSSSWKDVCRALLNLLMIRPNSAHDAVTLRFILSSDLAQLKSWGLNVGRILSQKHERAQKAEDERRRQEQESRRKELEKARNLEKARIEEKARNEQQAMKTQEVDHPDQVSLPGAFEESPERERSEDNLKRPKEPKGLWASLTKRFGLDDTSAMSGQIKDMLTNGTSSNEADRDPSPPPYNSIGPHTKGPSIPDPIKMRGSLDPETLLKAAKACRPYDSRDLYSAPETRLVKESTSYCDSSPREHITLVTQSASGMQIFLAKRQVDKYSFAKSRMSAFNAFANLLSDCGRVFSLPPRTLHIFHDEQSSSIAFNTNGSLFCNFHCFEQFWTGMQLQQEQGQQMGQDPVVNYKAKALVFWYVTLCHELAHNLVGEHGSQHTFCSESFFVRHFFDISAIINSPSYALPR